MSLSQNCTQKYYSKMKSRSHSKESRNHNFISNNSSLATNRLIGKIMNYPNFDTKGEHEKILDESNMNSNSNLHANHNAFASLKHLSNQSPWYKYPTKNDQHKL